MHYSIKTISQLRPILQGFRKSKGLTQARMAEYLGVRQQSYAELEANPAAASVERLFKALRVLGVELVLSPAADVDAPADEVRQDAAPALPARRKPAPVTKALPPAPPKTRAKTTAGKTPKTGRASTTNPQKREDW